MTSNSALQSLRRTGEAIEDIRKSLSPFLEKVRSLNDEDGADDMDAAESQEIAEAQAAVALAMGTLRYMGCRLRGENPLGGDNKKKRKASDPLRLELDKMRKTLTTVRELNTPDEVVVTANDCENDTRETEAATTDTMDRGGGVVLDIEASKRMVHAALSTECSVKKEASNIDSASAIARSSEAEVSSSNSQSKRSKKKGKKRKGKSSSP